MTEIPRELPVPAGMLERQRRVVEAYAAGAQRRRSRRRMAVAAVAVAVLATLVATPALGLGSKLAELFEGTPATPPVQEVFTASDEVQKRFAAERHDRYSRVVVEEARGVIAVETPDGLVRLWAAPTEDGRQCSLVELEVAPSGGRVYSPRGCDGPSADGMSPGALWVAPLPSVQLVHVRVHDEDIVQVDVHVADGGVVRLPVVAGHAFGALDRSADLDYVVGLNADRDEVDRITRL